MYIIVVISVLVHLNCLLTSADPEVVSFVISRDKGHNNLSLTQDAELHLRIDSIPDVYKKNYNCTGWCDHGKTNLTLTCKFLRDRLMENLPYINATITKKWNKDDNGDWDCYFKRIVKENTTEEKGEIPEEEPDPVTRSFTVNVPEKKESEPNWLYIAGGVGGLVFLIIIGQTLCIIHFKKKARAVSRHANLTPKGSQVDDIARYSSLPAQKQIETNKDDTEPAIYEVLENIRAPNIPDPPPVTTIPQRKNYEQKKSTLERMKERLPMPIPPDEVYEVVETSPAPTRKNNNRTEIQRQMPSRHIPTGFSTQPRTPRTPLMARGTTASQTLRPQLLPSQLKHALEIRNRANTDQAPAPRVVPFNPGLPPQTTLGSTASLAGKELATRPPFNPGLPPHSPISRPPTGSPAFKKRPIPPPSGAVQRFPLPPFTAPGLKPLPPVERPSAGVAPRWKPPPPAKPKQLHPLPPPPSETTCKSLAMPINRNNGNDSPDEDDENEWVYEHLPQYNIYSL